MVEPILMNLVDRPEETPSPRSLELVKKWCYAIIALLSLVAFLGWFSDCALLDDNHDTVPDIIQGYPNRCTRTGDTVTALLAAVCAFLAATLFIVWNVAPATAGACNATAAHALFAVLVAACILGTESHSGTEVWLGIAAGPAFALAVASWKTTNTTNAAPLVVGRYPDRARDTPVMNTPELEPLVAENKN